jgi:hypothetical protein
MPVDEAANLPRDAKLMSLLLQAMDIEDYEGQVIPQLINFAHRNPFA